MRRAATQKNLQTGGIFRGRYCWISKTSAIKKSQIYSDKELSTRMENYNDEETNFAMFMLVCLQNSARRSLEVAEPGNSLRGSRNYIMIFFFIPPKNPTGIKEDVRILLGLVEKALSNR